MVMVVEMALTKKWIMNWMFLVLLLVVSSDVVFVYS